MTAGAAPEGYIEEYGFFDNLAEWTDIIKLEICVCLAGEYAAGLRSDGTMVYEGICDVGWTGPSDHIIDFASSGWMLIGLREDGSVTANGEDSEGASVFLDWTDMKQVDCGDTEAIGLRENGTILVTSEKREAIQDLVDIERIELNLETPFVAYGTNGRVYIYPIAEEDAYRTVTLYCLEAGEQYSFRYDSDILEYTGQGGDFYLVGSTSTKCYLHLIVQNWEEESYDSVRSAASDNNIEDFTLESGRRAFGYAGSVENTYHAVIDAEGIVPSGNGLIKIYLGSIDSWPYSCEQIISMVDSGF